jgi:sn-glycerol 3-phosphate transport system ATP-binding protein
MSMADKIVLMNDGKIEQIDVPQVLYNKPNSIFVAQFVGSPPMNIIRSDDKLLGVRPEHITITDKGINASVISCDYHGADTIVLADLGDQPEKQALIKIRFPGHAVFAPRQPILIHWDSECEHHF